MIQLILINSADKPAQNQWAWWIQTDRGAALRSEWLGIQGYPDAKTAREDALKTYAEMREEARQQASQHATPDSH